MQKKKRRQSSEYNFGYLSHLLYDIESALWHNEFSSFQKFFHFFENCQSVNTISADPFRISLYFTTWFFVFFFPPPKKIYDTRRQGLGRDVFFDFWRPPRMVKPLKRGRELGCVARVKTLHLGESRYDLGGLRFASAFIGWVLSAPLSDESRRSLPQTTTVSQSCRGGTSRYAELVGASDGVIFLSGDTRRA